MDCTRSGLRVSVSRDSEVGDDEVALTFDDPNVDFSDYTRVLVAVQRQFVPMIRDKEIERTLGPGMAEFYRRREESLSRLEAVNERLTAETHEYRLRLDDQTATLKKTMEDDYSEKVQELATEYGKKESQLRDREEDLDKRRQELDDRSARHARRANSEALQQKISQRSQRFSLTRDTQRKRIPIHSIFAVLLLVTGGLLVQTLIYPPAATDGVVAWVQVARLPLSILGFGLTAVFYIRWNDRWFRQHADQEFRLQQLALDVDRAGYATEMLMEWQEDKQGEMPSVLVDRLTAGLFTDQTTAAQARHPTEDLASALLKATSGLTVDVPGVGEARLTRRQIRRFDRDLKKRDGE